MSVSQDTSVSSIELEFIKLERLEQGDKVELQKLVSSSQALGFFYLDLTHNSFQSYLEDLRSIYKLGQQYFELPQAQKMDDYEEGIEKG